MYIIKKNQIDNKIKKQSYSSWNKVCSFLEQNFVLISSRVNGNIKKTGDECFHINNFSSYDYLLLGGKINKNMRNSIFMFLTVQHFIRIFNLIISSIAVAVNILM